MKRSARASSLGFTLIEILLVVFLIALVSAITVPNLQKLGDSVEGATQRDGVLADLNGLSYRAFALGQGFELSGDSVHRVLSDGNPVLALPAGWALSTDQPIHFSFNGYCSGGHLLLHLPDGSQIRLIMAPPTCKLKADDAA